MVEAALERVRSAHNAAQARIATGQPGCIGRYFPLRADFARIERLDPAVADDEYEAAEAAYRAIATASQTEIDRLIRDQAARLPD